MNAWDTSARVRTCSRCRRGRIYDTGRALHVDVVNPKKAKVRATQPSMRVFAAAMLNEQILISFLDVARSVHLGVCILFYVCSTIES